MITAPYNFVPLNEKVFYPKWAELVSQDVPFEDGEDGVIELEITNVSPIFTRNGHTRDEDMPYSSHVLLPDGRRRYFIPGSSMKGCIRSVMEIMTFGKMNFYNDDSFAMPRAFNTNDSTNKPYRDAIKSTRCGWLQKQGDKYVLYPCKHGIQPIGHRQLKELFPNFDLGADHQTAERKQRSLSKDEIYPTISVQTDEVTYMLNKLERSVPAGDYQVVCTGYMHGKKHEYLFSCVQEKTISVSKETIQQFESVHSRTEYYNGRSGKGGFLRSLLKKGQPIPVFYTVEGNEVKYIGIARMLRVPYAVSVKDAVGNSQKSIDNQRADLPETIFGFIGDDATKGRVAFGHAFCDSTIPDSNLIPVSGVQGQPSASYFPLYLRQTKSVGKYVSYEDKTVQIAGRKRYRIATGSKTFELPQGNDNEKVLGYFNALPANLLFCEKIVLHNMRPAEIGALLASLSFNGTDGCYHNLGLAKSFGFGKIACTISMKGFRYNQEDYIRAFELEMMSAGFDMTNNRSLNALAAIAAEHSDSDMQMMELDGYENGKKNTDFSILQESQLQLHTIVTAEDLRLRKEAEQAALEAADRRQEEQLTIRTLLDGARKYMDCSDWKNAIGMLTEAAEIDRSNGLHLVEITQLTDECNAQIQSQKGTPLQTALSGKLSLGNIIGRTSKWIKTTENGFTENELYVLKEAILALPAKEQKSLSAKRKDIVKAIGEEWTNKLFELMK